MEAIEQYEYFCEELTLYETSKQLESTSLMVYKLSGVETIYQYEVIFNGKYLLVFPKLIDSIKTYLLIYKLPEDKFTKALEACKWFEIPIKDFSVPFHVLHGGNTIIFVDIGKACIWQLILDESFNLNYFQKDFYLANCSLFCTGVYAINGDLLATSYYFDGFDGNGVLIHVFDCSPQIKAICSIDMRKYTGHRVKDIYLSSNNKKLAIITSNFEYITIDLQSGVGEVKELKFLPFVDTQGISSVKFVNIQYESIDKEIVLIITSTGFILNLNKEKTISLVDKIQQNVDNIHIISSQLCIFNKWIYIFCENHFIYVYDPFQEVVVHEFINKNKIRIDWFGDQLFYNTKDKIIVQQIFKHKCFSLRYIARKALYKYHSENELKELKLGKKINQLIFDNVY